MKTKRIGLLIACLLATVVVSAQTKTFSNKSSWTELTTNLFYPAFFKTTTYKVDGDTLMNGKNYLKLFKNNAFYAGLRETEDNKIYVHFPDLDSWFQYYFPSSNKELLIYDFGWHPGKTLYHQTTCERKEINGTIWPSLDSTVQAVLGSTIDSILLLDGKYYKHIGGLIRGIGSTSGFFISTFALPTDGSQFTLLCFHIDSMLVYRNPNYTSCDITTNVLSVSGDKIKLYPNPANDFIAVEFSENLNLDVFKIFDTKGMLVKTYKVKGKNKFELDVRNLVKGVYIYSAISISNEKLSGKIMVK